MKPSVKTLAFVALALTASQFTRAEDGIAGKWRAEFDSQIGRQKYTFELKMDGTNLVGRAVGERENGTNDVAIVDAKIDKDKVSFVEPLNFQDNEIRIEYSGTLAGDELKLHRKVGDFAEYDIVAKRLKADDAKAAPATNAPPSKP